MGTDVFQRGSVKIDLHYTAFIGRSFWEKNNYVTESYDRRLGRTKLALGGDKR